MIKRGNDSILPVIGLEIHVQLKTNTKLFCRCRNNFGDPPNSNVCPVCIGLPGSLPVMNKKAVELSIRVGHALNCTIADYTKWDRKSYYYPDLPKNYQISQYDLPLCLNGYMNYHSPEKKSKKIRVLRAHLEEDAGKNIHDNPNHTDVDLNRTGIPLLEIVSEPDMNCTDEVLFYAKTMQKIVRWVDASEANMEMGHMRFEPNINLHITRNNKTYKTPIVEVKNLNSFKSLEQTIDFEIERQYEEWEEAPDEYTIEKLGKQNRGFDTDLGETVFQREKEEAHDYRYFPEPDLVPVKIDNKWKKEILSSLGEPLFELEERYRSVYKLTEREIDALTSEKALSDLLEDSIELGGNPKHCVNLLLGKASALANQKNCSLAELGIKPEQLSELSKMINEGKVNATTASNKILEHMIEENIMPLEYAQSKGLLIETDVNKINEWVDETVSANPNIQDDILNDPKKQKKAFGYLMGQIMQKSRGTASPLEVKRILKEKLGLQDNKDL
jgi:aspartyl-tRNA(Asn)/glutamyl-tRNA(Gln) amidotransferase subunit B